jgi:serine O-acetyltransferase
VIDKPSQKVAAGPNERHERNEDDNHREHDGGLEPLVAVADRKVAEASCPNRAGHRGGSDQQHERHREARDQAWQRLWDKRLADDGPVSPPIARTALYPRHFGPPGLDARDADEFVTRTVATALPALKHEIELALALEQEDARDAANANPRSAAESTRSFASALPRIRAALDKDVRAAFANDPSAKSIHEVIFCLPGVAAIMRHRLAHELYRLGVPLMARIVAEIAHALAGVDIHPGAEIEEGFFIDHGTGVVIGETAVIGRNVRIYQAVTLGAKRSEVGDDGQLRKSYLRHPIVEDDVVIYAGATILGRITIGRGSSIGGNVWLTESVPQGSRITQAKAQTTEGTHSI